MVLFWESFYFKHFKRNEFFNIKGAVSYESGLPAEVPLCSHLGTCFTIARKKELGGQRRNTSR